MVKTGWNFEKIHQKSINLSCNDTLSGNKMVACNSMNLELFYQQEGNFCRWGNLESKAELTVDSEANVSVRNPLT